MQTVDLRSDTLTQPTPEMRNAILQAEVGDDVFGEDPTINRLQDKVARLTGKEAALFVTSGTQGNQIAINAHTLPGQEVIVDRNCHIFNYESGAPAMLSGVQLHPIDNTNGTITPADLEAVIRPDDAHYPQTGLVCLENTINRAGGAVVDLPTFRSVTEYAGKCGLPVHLDGARLWNASIATGSSISDFCQTVDSVSLCFSKGLGAPVGSILAGSHAFIRKAHYYRKVYGGGIRQGGLLAAAAIFAIDNHFQRLADDHRRAKALAREIASLPGITIDLSAVQSNIVIFELDPAVKEAGDFLRALAEHGSLMLTMGPQRIRAVTHLHISDDDIEQTVAAIRTIVNK